MDSLAMDSLAAWRLSRLVMDSAVHRIVCRLGEKTTMDSLAQRWKA